ncbi:NAD-dependent glutamate dehydrogenase, partial [Tulasnella sp. 417]
MNPLETSGTATPNEQLSSGTKTPGRQYLSAGGRPGGSRTGSETPSHRIENEPGYTTPVFSGKLAQQKLVETKLASSGFIPRNLVSGEVGWFYENLGIDDTYFANESQDVIAADNPKCLNKDGKTDIRLVSDKSFLEKASENTLDVYQNVMWNVENRFGPVIEMFEVEGTRERRVVIGYKMGGTKNFFSALSDLYHFYGLFSARKYVEQFANGVTIISLYLNPLPQSSAPPIESTIFQVIKEASLLYCLPENPFFRTQPTSADPSVISPQGGLGHAVQEATYAYCGWVFAQHFCNRLGSSYHKLKTVLDENDANHAEVLNDIKTRFREETYTRQSIMDVIFAHPDLIRLLYVNFAMEHYPASEEEASKLVPTLSYQRLQTHQYLSYDDLRAKLRKSVPNKHELAVLEAFLEFNRHILKTNFYQPTKVALSFRLNP